MRTIALLALLLVVGCASPPTGIGCDVETPTRRGRGVVVGPRTVLTVTHVIFGYESVTVDGMPGRVVAKQRRTTETGDDGIAVVEMDPGFEFAHDRIATLTEKVHAGVSYLPKRGEQPWPWGLEPGDSGSPILDSQRRVTGLVRAVYGRAEPLDQNALPAGLKVDAPRNAGKNGES